MCVCIKTDIDIDICICKCMHICLYICFTTIRIIVVITSTILNIVITTIFMITTIIIIMVSLYILFMYSLCSFEVGLSSGSARVSMNPWAPGAQTSLQKTTQTLSDPLSHASGHTFDATRSIWGGSMESTWVGEGITTSCLTASRRDCRLAPLHFKGAPIARKCNDHELCMAGMDLPRVPLSSFKGLN